ncbi:hypothetical protein MXB_2007 [Myxobolus squamalis]|nr:hypothetical protein MXB_2007 [Myxobolus squamalis]
MRNKKLAKRYYDKLFKEYCISDLVQYKLNRVKREIKKISKKVKKSKSPVSQPLLQQPQQISIKNEPSDINKTDWKLKMDKEKTKGKPEGLAGGATVPGRREVASLSL